MKIHSNDATFDLFRLSAAKEVVDLCANTLRTYNTQGLPFYRRGRAIFVSRRDLEEFIRRNPTITRGGKEQRP